MGKKKWKIPIDKHGGVMVYANESCASMRRYYGAAEWLDPDTLFSLSLKFHGIERGQSSARFIFEDVTNPKRHFPFSMSEMATLLQKAVIRHGFVEGTFEVAKRGQNYSMRWLRSG